MTTCDNIDLKGLERTRKDFWSEKCDRLKTEDRQTDGVTDNASTREACASKNSIKVGGWGQQGKNFC